MPAVTNLSKRGVLRQEYIRGIYDEWIEKRYCCLCSKRMGKTYQEYYNSQYGHYIIEDRFVAHTYCVYKWRRGGFKCTTTTT